ncbi:UNVERIFIED_CONTAM: hypothetical protein Sangu_3071600 [Sesamum angustifolium]|uniref:Uncharacterized protein n=1 Tax=Sesamum angustifolium TaxID=2727405 RepID=A0AAW2KDZ9_9LAMI
MEFLGLAEAFNRTLCNLLKKVVSKSKWDWNKKIREALWAYWTTHWTATQATPYSFVYGVEAVFPLESQIPSLRIVVQEALTPEDNARLRLEEQEALDEKKARLSNNSSTIKPAWQRYSTTKSNRDNSKSEIWF